MSTLNNGILHLRSTRSVTEVLDSLLSMLQGKKIQVFALVDHSGEAAKVGMTMPDTKLVIFGNPQAGTPVMINVPGIALDLPLKILIAEDAGGFTRISYNAPAYLESRYSLDPGLAKNLAVIENLAAAIAG